MAHDRYNDLLSLMANNVQRNNLVKIIKISEYFSIMLYKTTETVQQKKQIAVRFHILIKNFETEEYFMGICETSRTDL